MYFLCKNKEEFEEKKDNVRYKLTYKSGETERLHFISNKKGNPLSCISSLGIYYRAEASLKWLNEKSLSEFKKNIYISGKLECLGKYSKNWGRTGYNINNFFEILMSDNRELINYLIKNIDIICYEEKTDYHKENSMLLFHNRDTLLALKGDWENLKKRSNIFLNDVPKDMKKEY